MQRSARRWAADRAGVAATEAALIFPIMLTLMLGTYDLGNGILADQKTIRASQIAADLITRERTVSAADIDEAIKASQLAYEPMDSTTFGIDIVSVKFDSKSNPEIVWRETRNMKPDPDVLSRVAALAEPDNGVVVVNVHYVFIPLFSGFVIHEMQLEEIAFAHGRKSNVVTKTRLGARA